MATLIWLAALYTVEPLVERMNEIAAVHTFYVLYYIMHARCGLGLTNCFPNFARVYLGRQGPRVQTSALTVNYDPAATV